MRNLPALTRTNFMPMLLVNASPSLSSPPGRLSLPPFALSLSSGGDPSFTPLSNGGTTRAATHPRHSSSAAPIDPASNAALLRAGFPGAGAWGNGEVVGGTLAGFTEVGGIVLGASGGKGGVTCEPCTAGETHPLVPSPSGSNAPRAWAASPGV